MRSRPIWTKASIATLPRSRSPRTTGGSSTFTTRRLARLLLLTLVAGALASAPSGAQEDDREAIQALLQRRADAILERDEEAFAATLDDPNSAFGRRQATLFENLGTVPLDAYRLEADWSVYGDLARPSDRRRYEADDVAIPFTREKYRLEGFDRRIVHHDAYFTFVKRDGSWRIADDSDLEDLGLFTQRSLWDFDPVTTDSSEHFLAIAPQCCIPDLGRLLSTAEQSLNQVERFWEQRWQRRVPLLIPGSTEDLARVLQATYPVENYTAFSFWTGGAGGNLGARVIVNPERFSGDGSLRSFEILTHELFHVATLPHSGPFVPNWLDEGLAQFVQFGGGERIDSYDVAVAATGDAHAPEGYEFFIGDETSVFRQYQRSASLVGYMVERWGYERIERFYLRLGLAGGGPGVERYQIERALREVLGVDLDDLEREWASTIGA